MIIGVYDSDWQNRPSSFKDEYHEAAVYSNVSNMLSTGFRLNLQTCFHVYQQGARLRFWLPTLKDIVHPQM